mmetsp:Transcript_105341/g.186103  ORF Transcript_105341/g.186103 Transcript_105341/m.186103 type:complete len:223 (+) Transcript_105341:251-919(+)
MLQRHGLLRRDCTCCKGGVYRSALWRRLHVRMPDQDHRIIKFIHIDAAMYHSPICNCIGLDTRVQHLIENVPATPHVLVLGASLNQACVDEKIGHLSVIVLHELTKGYCFVQHLSFAIHLDHDGGCDMCGHQVNAAHLLKDLFRVCNQPSFGACQQQGIEGNLIEDEAVAAALPEEGEGLLHISSVAAGLDENSVRNDILGYARLLHIMKNFMQHLWFTELP